MGAIKKGNLSLVLADTEKPADKKYTKKRGR